jgi:atypical dual specificity phosphatase
MEDLRFARAVGCQAVLSLSEEPLAGPVLQELQLAYLHLPIEDLNPPSLQQAQEAVQFIKEQNEKGHPVLVHCGAGMGRTGTILACYLVGQGRTAQEAIDEVRRVRPGSVETEEQEQLVFKLAEAGV